MHRFLHRIQNFDMYRPYLPLSHLHDPHGHQEVHDGGVDQVPTYEIICAIHLLYLDFYKEFKNIMYIDLSIMLELDVLHHHVHLNVH